MTRDELREKAVEDEWQGLLDKDDRTSPEEYPDMCLITRDELAEMFDAVLALAGAEAVRVWEQQWTAGRNVPAALRELFGMKP